MSPCLFRRPPVRAGCILPAIPRRFTSRAKRGSFEGAPTQTDLTSPVVFRNGGFFVACCRIVSVVAGLMAVCMLVLAIGSLIPLGGMTFARAVSTFWWFFGVLCFASISPSLWAYGKRLSFYYVKLDQHGVEFRFGTAKTPDIVPIAWDQVSAIQHKNVANTHQYTILAKDGSSARFSSDTFFRTKRMAQLIAERAHLSVEEL